MTTVAVKSGTVKVSAFGSLDRARSWVGAKEWIVMGTPGVFWVCRPVDARKLIEAGYELVRG